ncbi:hypothetical protein D7X99_10255 [Corallococcus sp. AB032C]|nr:hypothetical protein D7X99_10255 [Corallococcus sp. AB032C]
MRPSRWRAPRARCSASGCAPTTTASSSQCCAARDITSRTSASSGAVAARRATARKHASPTERKTAPRKRAKRS